MSLGYSAGQLLRYHRYCRENPDGRVLPPGGRRHWDDMSVTRWLAWFDECLTRKVTRGTEAQGKGNRAKRRAESIRKANAKCKWCGQLTGGPQFCDRSCFASYGGF